MAADRQTPCSYFLFGCVCIKAGKLIIPDCPKCNEYEPQAKSNTELEHKINELLCLEM